MSRRSKHPGLLALRVGAVLLVLLLLVNPSIPGEDRPPTLRVLVDPDPALAADDGDGVILDRFLERAAALHARGGILHRLTGSEGVILDPGALEAMGPAEASGSIDEALLQMAEQGADSLLLVSTLRVDPAPLTEALERLPHPLRIERVGGAVRNVAVAGFELPEAVPPDSTLEARLQLRGEETMAGDSIEVRIEARPFVAGAEEVARVVYQGWHPAPPTGEERTLTLSLPPPEVGADDPPLVRYEARVSLEGDGFAPDDARLQVVLVGDVGRGIVVVSMRPDWEPRTLLPVLERATGLSGEGWLRVGPDRYLALRTGGDPVTTLGPDEVVRRVEGAEIVVVHGVADPLPPAIEGAVRALGRVVHLPAGPEGARLAGVQAEGPIPGSHPPHPDLPPSPVAPYLAGIPMGALPPLESRLRPMGEPAGTEVLHLRGAADELHPGLLLLEAGEARSALALGSGFWRWGARAGAPSRAYSALWAGVAGWLLESPGRGSGPGVAPVDLVPPRGEPIEWGATDLAGRTLEVELRPGDAPEGPLLQTESVEVPVEGRFTTPALPPGLYHYRVVDPDGPPAEGIFEVERFQGALLRPAMDPDITGSPAVSHPREGRALRTHPLPWLLLLGLLCLEWVGRRRAGLR